MTLTEGTPTKNGEVSESNLDFSYELPDTAPDPNFDQAARDAIAEIAAEFDAPDEEVVEDEGEVVDKTAAPEEVVKLADEDDLDPKLSRGLERLVSRELKAKEEEARAQATLAAIKAERTSLAELKGLKNTKELLEQLDSDPWGAIKAQGKDPDHMIRVLMAQSLEASGGEVPEGLKKYLESSASNRKIKALEDKIANQERAANSARYYNSVDQGAREYVSKNVDVKKYSTVASALKADLDYVHREVMEEIVRDAHTKAAQDPDGDPMSYEQAVANVEARWAKLKTLFGSKTEQVQNGTTTGTKIASPGTKTSPPTTKPASRPLAPWLQKPQNDIYEQGIQEAMREYARSETEQKARR